MNDNWWREREDAYKKQQQRVMNEKFKKLWTNVRQSDEGKKVWDDPLYSDDVRDEIYREMFAELIVKECIDMCDEVDRINKYHIEKDFIDPEWGPKECIDVIKTHFGVEYEQED